MRDEMSGPARSLRSHVGGNLRAFDRSRAFWFSVIRRFADGERLTLRSIEKFLNSQRVRGLIPLREKHRTCGIFW